MASAVGNGAQDPPGERDERSSTGPAESRLLLVVDQFEEVFAAPPEEATAFQEALSKLAASPGCWVVLTVRADFYAELMSSPLWPQIRGHRLEIQPMTEAGLRRAIYLPAESVGVYVEAALVERLAADAAGEPGVLPLVQETLVLLWEHVVRRFLGLAAYDALVLPRRSYDRATAAPIRSGLQVAIARRADAALAELRPEQETIARRIFLRMVQFGEGRADTRRQQPLDALRSPGDDPLVFDATIRLLVQRRLLTLTGEERAAGGMVDISHEALIAGWPKLQAWIDERREAELTRRRLETKASEWSRLGRGEGGRLDEAELTEAERWLEGADAAELGSSEELAALVAESRTAVEETRRNAEAARQRELDQALALAETERRRAEDQAHAARRLRRSLAAAAVFALLAVIAAAGATYGLREANEQRDQARHERARADQEAQVARARALAGLAPLQLPLHDDERAALLALQAYRFNDGSSGAARTQVDEALRAVLGARHFSRVLHHQAEISALAFSPDGRKLASGDRAGTVWLWDFDGAAEPVPLVGNQDWVLALAFSPTGSTLASGARDGSVRLWDLRTLPATPTTLGGLAGEVRSLAFSPDGQSLAAGGDDPAVSVWAMPTPSVPATIALDRAVSIDVVAFDPDGQLHAMGSGSDQALLLWEPGEEVAPVSLTGSQNWRAASAAFDAEGTMLAVGGGDGSVRLWDVTEPTAPPDVLRIPDPRAVIASVAFDARGRYLAGVSHADGGVWLWEPEASSEPTFLRGHENVATAVLFSPDSRMLASGSGDKTVRLWDMAEPSVPAVLRGHTDAVRSVAFRPAGNALASGGRDGTVRLWDLARPASAPTFLLDHDAEINAVAWAPDGRFLAAGGSDGRVWLLEPDNPSAAPRELRGLGEGVTSVAFDPSGGTIAAGSWTGNVVTWELAQPDAPSSLPGHPVAVQTIAFDPLGATLAAGGCLTAGASPGTCDRGGTVVWNLDRPSDPPLTLPGPDQDRVASIAFAPDGKRLAEGSQEGSIRLWDLDDPQTPIALPGPAFAVASVAFHPDGQTIAAGNWNGTVSVWWDLNGMASHGLLPGTGGYVYALAFGPDGQTLAAGGASQDINIWTSTDAMAGHVCAKVGRNLTEEEWRQFVGADVPYERTCPNVPAAEPGSMTPTAIAA